MSSPASNPSPTPDPAAPEAPIPARKLSTSPNDLLALLMTGNFNLPALAMCLTPDQLLAFVTDSQTRQKLEAILDFNLLCLTIRQTKDRHAALDTLREVLATSTDPVEQRRAATNLLRATNPIKSPGRVNPGQDQDQDGDDQAPARLPRPTCSPKQQLTAQEVIDSLRRAMLAKNQSEENTGLATIAAFCDDDATLDGEPLPTDNPAECIESLDDSPLKALQTSTKSKALTEHASLRENDAIIPVRFATGPESRRTVIAVTLARRNISKKPGCWLIAAIHTNIPHPTRNTS